MNDFLLLHRALLSRLSNQLKHNKGFYQNLSEVLTCKSIKESLPAGKGKIPDSSQDRIARIGWAPIWLGFSGLVLLAVFLGYCFYISY